MTKARPGRKKGCFRLASLLIIIRLFDLTILVSFSRIPIHCNKLVHVRLQYPIRIDFQVNPNFDNRVSHRAPGQNRRRDHGFSVNYGLGWIQHPRNSPHYGGSGVNTTISDLIKWEKNFFDRRFGGDRFYQLMHRTQHFGNGMDNQAFGLYEGLYKNRHYWAWDGGDFGISAQIMRFPGQQIAIIVLSNVGNGNAAEKAQRIADILIEHKEL
ncbi:MAG TPA: hypothetical protein VG101_02710 [Puia sp.]|nr:hypothetical protein [Puia sp.]